MDKFPRYVLEYLIDDYCAEKTFVEDFAQVKRRLSGDGSVSDRYSRSRTVGNLSESEAEVAPSGC